MRRRFLAMALAAALTLSIPGAPAAAAAQTMPLTAAVRTLQNYGIVDKLPESELRLGETISRAEMAKVLGAALKLQQAADQAKNQSPFPDTAGHWAAGWIAVARDRGLFQGRDDGRFHPQDQVTYAEVLTVLLRLTGRGPQATSNWPWGAIAAAAEYGMVPADMNLGGRMNDSATRGDVFRLTAIAAGRVLLAGSSESLLQNQGDRTPPTLDLVRVPTVTGDWRPILTGKAADAVTLEVGGQPVALQPDGSFSTQVELRSGSNAITFVAMDGAGNRTEKTVQILLQSIARLEFAPAVIETSAGQSFKPVVVRYDINGQPAAADEVTWSYDAGALKRDPVTGLFTAASPGDYTLRATVEGAEATARVIVAGKAAQLQVTPATATVVAGGAPVAVTVRVLDDQGRLVTAGSNQVQLSTMPAQAATFDMPMQTTKGGVATAYLSPGQAVGGLGIQATIQGATKIVSPVVPISVEQRRVAAIQVSTEPPNVVPKANQYVTLIATAVDQVGLPIAVREDTTVSLGLSNNSVLSLTGRTAVIKAGTSSSDAAGTNGRAITVGNSGTVTVSGSLGAMPVTGTEFRATSAGALAKLDVQVVREAAAADKLSAALVAVTRRDAAGNVAVADTTPVILFSTVANASISQVSDSGGVALFAVRSGQGGRVDLAAGLPGRPELNSRSVTVAFVQSTNSTRPVIRTSARSAVVGSSVTAYVALESTAGQVLANPGPPLKFVLSGANVPLTVTELTIPTGATRSGDSIVNIPAGTTLINLNGSMVGGDKLAPATVSVTPLPPTPPDQTPTGYNLVAVPTQSGRPPVAGEDVRFVVRARNGNQQLSGVQGAQAFSVRVLINGQPVTGPVPGLTVKSGPQTLQPDAAVRTTNGETEIWVRYTGVGEVKLQPMPAAASYAAFDQWGVAGQAGSTSSYQSIAGKVTYTADALDHLDVSVTPNLGDRSQGVIKAARGRFANVRLAPVDRYGNPAGDSCLATLTQVRTSLPGALMIRASAADVTEQSMTVGAAGYAEFMVAATTDLEATSEWSPLVICGTKPLTYSGKVTVSTTVHSAPTPTIEYAASDATRIGTVRASDAYVQVTIARLPGAPDSAELLVYDGTTMVGRFGPVSGSAASTNLRTVSIPTSVFAGPDRSVVLRVRIHSGAAVSEESVPVVIYYTNYTPVP